MMKKNSEMQQSPGAQGAQGQNTNNVTRNSDSDLCVGIDENDSSGHRNLTHRTPYTNKLTQRVDQSDGGSQHQKNETVICHDMENSHDDQNGYLD